MKSFILIFSATLLFSCSPQKTTSTGISSSLPKTDSKGMKMHGTIVVKSVPSEGQTEMPVLYFDNGIPFRINFSESKVSKSEIRKFVYKDIDILGEIKTGQTYNTTLKNKEESTSSKKEQYLVVYKIIE